MAFETTSGFAAALADPAASPPLTTRGRLGVPDARRFSIYRNNVAVALIGVLEARYPVSRRIVGDDLFRAMARAFAGIRKPRSPVMIAYGEDFPEFAAACVAPIQAGPISSISRMWRVWRTPGSRPITQKMGRLRRSATLAAEPRSIARNADRVSCRSAAFAVCDTGRFDLGVPSKRGRAGRAKRMDRRRRAHHPSRLRRQRAHLAAAGLRLRREVAGGRDAS